jgi:hypothetical protein
LQLWGGLDFVDKCLGCFDRHARPPGASVNGVSGLMTLA